MVLNDFETLPVGTIETLEEAARTFREYETSHSAKAARAVEGTAVHEERTLKARRNKLMAEKIEKILALKKAGM
jgi:hypothetical protein